MSINNRILLAIVIFFCCFAGEVICLMKGNDAAVQLAFMTGLSLANLFQLLNNIKD